jgi:hypothetical protein
MEADQDRSYRLNVASDVLSPSENCRCQRAGDRTAPARAALVPATVARRAGCRRFVVDAALNPTKPRQRRRATHAPGPPKKLFRLESAINLLNLVISCDRYILNREPSNVLADPWSTPDDSAEGPA